MNEQSCIIAKMCQECVQQTTDKCEGKTREEVQPGKKPCKKYAFDENLLSAETIENGPKQPAKNQTEGWLNVIHNTPKPAYTKQRGTKPLPGNKTKADKFTRLSAKRLDATLDSIRKLSNLANPYVYQWTEQQVEHIISELKYATIQLEHNLL